MKMQQIFCEVDTCKHFDHQGKCKLKNIQVAPAGPYFYGQNNHDTFCESLEQKE